MTTHSVLHYLQKLTCPIEVFLVNQNPVPITRRLDEGKIHSPVHHFLYCFL
jgi:hypothetical protein